MGPIPLPVIEDPVLFRQYRAFTAALAASSHEGFQSMWLQKIAEVIRAAYQKESKEYAWTKTEKPCE